MLVCFGCCYLYINHKDESRKGLFALSILMDNIDKQMIFKSAAVDDCELKCSTKS